MTDLFVSVTSTPVKDFKRNGRGQPVITLPDGSKTAAYNRPSSWGKKIEDMYGINQWEKRCIVAGFARTPSLIARTVAIQADPKLWSKADKDALNVIADEAKTAARANQAADIGTALHTLTERADLGEDLSDLPEPFAADIAAYRAGMERHGLVTYPEWVEVRMVCDELKLAGTADRLVTTPTRPVPHVFDLKTGESIELAALGYAVQLAIYAHSHVYDVATGQRHDTMCDRTVAYIGHLPAGQGKFSLHEVDIVAGWEAAMLAADIDRWRKRRGLLVAVPDVPTSVEQPAVEGVCTASATPSTARIEHLRARCRKVAELSQETAAAMASFWPAGVPALSVGDLSGAELDLIDAHVATYETAVSAPFHQPLEQGAADVDVVAVDEPAPLLPARPHEGDTVDTDDEQLVTMKTAYAFLDPEAAGWMASIVGESIRAGRSIHLATALTRRRVAIVDGLVTLAVAGLRTTVRGLVHEITMNHDVLDDRHHLGAVVSILDAAQAQRFAALAQDLVATPAA